MIDIKALFEKFSNANFFSRVDNIHILELHVGLDEKGRKAIIVCPNHHRLIHKLNPVFNPDDRCFEYPDGTKEKIKIDYICRSKSFIVR